jgi:mRNA-degrading endonuclease RelE of RelBE toxin-antitoxin system
MYTIRYAPMARDHLRRLSAYRRQEILDEIDVHLPDAPTVPSKRRKCLPDLVTPWPAEPPVWQLTVGDYRVFYDVSEDDQIVMVRAVRRKPPHTRTEDIL